MRTHEGTREKKRGEETRSEDRRGVKGRETKR